MTDADSAVPPRLDEDAISKLELTEVADLIRTRQLTSAEVTESTLRRIERLDPQLKSYAFVMPETALAAARAADADIARGHYEGVLHGVPIGVKDLCYTVDAPTAAGTTIFRDFRPAYDATVVARLRAAGAVIIGKLAMTEGAYLGYHPSLPTPGQSLGPDSVGGRVLERLRRGHRGGIVLRLDRVGHRGVDSLSDEHVRRHRDQTDVGPGQPSRRRRTCGKLRPRRADHP